ncbi:MAG: hypothetical protein KDH92_09715 [Chloroflexi bacterium]|nr:hypothetical protein [Chloroflexota bacterium]
MHTDSTTTDHPTYVAGSADVKAKAAHLAVRYLERGRFDVSSGSRPGLVHRVTMPVQGALPETWVCTCDWAQFGNAMCSHVRAAQLEAERICRQRGITPAWAPKPAPALPAPAHPELPAVDVCPTCNGLGHAAQHASWAEETCWTCDGSGEAPVTCEFCEGHGEAKPAVVRVRDWQGHEDRACADCLRAIEEDPAGWASAVVVGVFA